MAAIVHRLELCLRQQGGNLLLAEIGAALNRHALLAAGGAISGRHLQQAVGIDVKRHLHLGHAPGGRWDAGQPEPPQRFVVRGHLALALKHVDFHRVLIGLRGAE